MGGVRGVVCGSPVNLQVLGQVLAGILQLVLVQDDVEELLKGAGGRSGVVRGPPLALAALGWGVGACQAHRGALHQFVGCHHLHVEMFHLRLAAGLDESLKDLGRGKRRATVAGRGTGEWQ